MSVWLDHKLIAVTHLTDLAPEYVPPEPGGDLPWMILATIIVVGVSVAIGYWVRFGNQVPILKIHDELTLELCRAHRLGFQHRSILAHLAKQANLSHPAELFLSSAIFDAAVVKANGVKRLGLRQRGLLFEVKRCLFE